MFELMLLLTGLLGLVVLACAFFVLRVTTRLLPGSPTGRFVAFLAWRRHRRAKARARRP